MARSGASPSVGFLLEQAGLNVDAGQGAPMRIPTPNTQMFKGGSVNESEYQKQLLFQLLKSVPVVMPTSFQRGVTIGFNLTTADIVAITAPPEIRSFLLIRNDQTSGGNVMVALDTAASAATAFVVLSPGGYILMDIFVVQNDIHLAAASGTALAVVTYANARFNPAPI